MRNGLYSIHVDLLDGRLGRGSGVIMFYDGTIRGGDAYLFYTGSYSVQEKSSTFRGEVSIGVSGTFTDTAGTMNGTALVGKQSLMFKATLRRLADCE